MQRITYTTLVATAFILAGCMTDSDVGSMNLNITDAAVDNADAVYVQFSGIEIKSAKNDDVVVSFDSPKRINLLNLQGDDSEPLLSGHSLAAGDYQSIQLQVDTGAGESVIVVDGAEHDLEIPSGSQSGLKLVRGFTVPAGGTADFTIDFDLRKSIVLSNNGYKLKPALRLIDNVSVGHIKGSVDLGTLGCDDIGNAVYVFQGNDATPDDVNISGSDSVVTTAMVKHNSEDNSYSYEAGFLSTGNYTVALSCEADTDDPEKDDDLSFVSQANVLVEDNKKTTQDL